MTRRMLRLGITALVLGAIACDGGPSGDVANFQGGEVRFDESAAALHRDALVWDAHNDLAYRVHYEGLDIGERLPAGHVDLPRLEEGEVDVQTVALFVQNFLYGKPGLAFRQAHELLSSMLEAIASNSHRVELARPTEGATEFDYERVWMQFKEPIADLVGWHRKSGDEKLRTCHAYEITYYTLLNSLND